ncbi:MAG: DUF4190 domain-containing protein [Candidatus Nanopelagicales bacterium]|nr:DUF4190 domain-containing protein [Candidatus Nanopelagicales bacterium]
MSTPEDGPQVPPSVPPVQPPPPPAQPPVPPPAGGGAPPPPPVPPAGQPPMPGAQPQKTNLPVISLVLGILSIFCLGFISGIAAIITGIMGRKRSKELGQSPTMATWGIITGIVGSIISIVILIVVLVSGAFFVNTASNQVTVAKQLRPATVAAEQYAAANNGSFEGLTTQALSSFNFVPSGDVVVDAVPLNAGSSYCIEGHMKDEPLSKIHVPASANNRVMIDINGESYEYSLGGCPTS